MQDFGYVCVPCVNGVSNMTLKLTFRTSSGDRNERIRVRANNLTGAVLYDSFNDANTSDGLPVGAVFSFDVPASATQVVVTVQGINHPSEYVKSTFSAECNLVIGTENGNDYIKFKVMDAKLRRQPRLFAPSDREDRRPGLERHGRRRRAGQWRARHQRCDRQAAECERYGDRHQGDRRRRRLSVHRPGGRGLLGGRGR